MKQLKAMSAYMAISLTVTACTWVKLTSEGEQVQVLPQEQTKNCKLLGNTTASLKDKVMGFGRNKEKVKAELETLARNAAARMGGDAVSVVSDIEEGRQSFQVFDCP